MADNVEKLYKTSEDMLSGNQQEFESSNRANRRNYGKTRVELYRPGMGLMSRKTGETSNEQWRNSKSPSPNPASQEAEVKNRQVHKSENEKIKFESNHFTKNDMLQGMRNISIDNNVPVIDLTQNLSGDEKKKMKKPEQQIYVPKPSVDRMKNKFDHIDKRANYKANNESNDEVRDRGQGEDHYSYCHVQDWQPNMRSKKKPRVRGKPDNRESVEHENVYTKKENRAKTVPADTGSQSNSYKRFGIDDNQHSGNSGNKTQRHYIQGKTTTKQFARCDKIDQFSNNLPINKVHMTNNETDKRDLRQTSEPRNLPQQHNRHNRQRDSRSMEHSNWSNDKNQFKPPVNRGGGGNMIQYNKPNSFDSLPPRFKKKYLEKNGLTQYQQSYLGNTVEDGNWDGGSLSFNSNSHQHQQHQTYSLSYNNQYQNYNKLHVDYEMTQSLPPERLLQSPHVSPAATPHTVSQSQENLPTVNNQTMPVTRSLSSHQNMNYNNRKTRDRWKNDNNEFERNKPQFRQRNQRYEKNYNQPRSGDGRGDIIRKISTSSISSINNDAATDTARDCSSPDTISAPIKVLDWTEEVEEFDKKEKDAMSRSSSVASLHNSNTNSQHIERRPRNRGNSGGHNRQDRSLSKDGSYRSNDWRTNDDRHKGHYGFHENLVRESSRDRYQRSSRENSRDRNDWRRSNDNINDGWRKDNNRKSVERDVRRNDKRDSKNDVTNWRSEIKKDEKPGGIIHLPANNNKDVTPNVAATSQRQGTKKQLFDPSNPSKPIYVSPTSVRVNTNTQSSDSATVAQENVSGQHGKRTQYSGESDSSSWYEQTHNDSIRLRSEIDKAETELQFVLKNATSGQLQHMWQRITFRRQCLQQILHSFLMTELKLCQRENVEQRIWKIAYYNLIECMRNLMVAEPESKEACKTVLIGVIDEGISYFETLIHALEERYRFKVDDYLTLLNGVPKDLGEVGLALTSVQKLTNFLGDLTRYREVTNDTVNFGKSKQWYTKSHQLFPKNSRPFNQLGIISYLGRRKFDSVYYYMRTLMASNPIVSAKESLVSIFDESRKKYEQTEKKRREEREMKYKERVKEKESEGSSLRREIWVHPHGGRRVHRTTSTSNDSRRAADSEDEELSNLLTNDINKRFTTSCLHVHGKLFSKVGMETFQDAGIQMLKEFRALLQHSPLPLGSTRFLQLLTLNMFAIENTQLKDTNNIEPGYRSAVQENALIISLQMYNLILERCVQLLKEQSEHPVDVNNRLLPDDVHVLLPAVKIWCDWLTCHTVIWNPPPCCTDYRVGPPGDAWSRSAALVNLLEELDYKKVQLHTEPGEGLELVKLPEDLALGGFPPLMYMDQPPIYTSSDNDMDMAQCCLRISKILFFGTVFLCGLEPPVVKLQKFDECSEYVSVVDSTGQVRDSPTAEHSDTEELMVESFSEGEEQGDDDDDVDLVANPEIADALTETKRLLLRREELERKHQRQERQRKRVQTVLERSGLSVVIEVKPKYLVPDTNCFIDHLHKLQQIAAVSYNAIEHIYMLAVPLIVLNELEGLARGGSGRDTSQLSLVEQGHMMTVSENARTALAQLRSPSRSVPTIKCVTTRGKFLNSFTPFNVDEDSDRDFKNDDRILATCLSLCKNSGKEESKAGEPRHLVREVVLLTEDRNLRVKALSRDVPVREVPDFAHWAGLG